MTEPATSRVLSLLAAIYSDTCPADVARRFAELVDAYAQHRPSRGRPQAWLIAYPDHIVGDAPPLASLREFVDSHLP
ncbi:MAG: hypothetical protein ACR2NG_00650, partial [Acidimicrobiia bacterium]